MKLGSDQPKAREPLAISFDAGGTLIRLRRSPGAVYAEAAARHGWTVEMNRVEAAFREIWKKRAPRPVAPGPREAEDRLWWREIASETVRRCNAPAAFPLDPWFDEVFTFYGTAAAWECFPDVLPTLERLARRYRLVVLSNFDLRLQQVFDELDLTRFFTDLLPSSQLGAEKPQPEAFSRMLEHCGLESSTVLHVGDEPAADWDGARKAGLSVFELRRPERGLEALERQLAQP